MTNLQKKHLIFEIFNINKRTMMVLYRSPEYEAVQVNNKGINTK